MFPTGKAIAKVLVPVQPRPIHLPFSAVPPRTIRASPIQRLSVFSTSRAACSDRKASVTQPGPDPKSTTSSRKDAIESGPGAAGSDAEFPTVTIESLGIGRNMKVFLMVVLGVFGTIETVFWAKALWIWLKKDRNVDNQSG